MRLFLIILDDYCRVVLSGDENDDYINASYIDVSFCLINFSQPVFR
jgi:protein tyrosine phosphatase